jgi:group I intron endonuclease
MSYTEIKPGQGFVYRWTNLLNNKWYIGSHEGCINDGYVASGKAIKDAIKKHTIQAFTRDILYVGGDFRELEELVLETLSAATDKSSYNLKNTAAGGDTWKGRRHTKEYVLYLQKISQPGELNGMYGRTHTEASRELIRQAKIGGIPWNKGKTGIYSEETTKKRSKSREGFSHSVQTRQVMSENRVGGLNANAKVVCIEGVLYSTKQEACKALQISNYVLNKLLKVYQDFRD